MNRRNLMTALGTLIFCGLLATQAQAGFLLGDSSNFALLFEGNGGNTLNFNNSNVSGNIGIGATGQFASAGGCSPGNCMVNGAVDFSAANTGGSQYSSTGTTYTGGGPYYSKTNVQTDLNNLNTLSQMLKGETGTSLTISSGGSVNASSGTLDTSGNRVFTLNSFNFANGTFTIDGSATDSVVINVTPGVSNSGWNGALDLSGGITSDHVLINFTAGNYGTLSGGDTLSISTNCDPGQTSCYTNGTFLDSNGAIQINHSVLDGRIFGGDTHNEQIVSGANINAPAGSAPEPSAALLIFLTELGIGGGLLRRWLPGRKRR